MVTANLFVLIFSHPPLPGFAVNGSTLCPNRRLGASVGSELGVVAVNCDLKVIPLLQGASAYRDLLRVFPKSEK